MKISFCISLTAAPWEVMEAISVLGLYKALQWNLLGCREANAIWQHLKHNLKKPFQHACSTKIVFPKASQSFQRVTSVTAETWIPHRFYTDVTQTLLLSSALHLVFCVFLGRILYFGLVTCSTKAGLLRKIAPVKQVGKSLC